MKTLSKVLLFMLGFPLMVILVVLESMYAIKNGASYGLMAYVGVILAAAMMVIFGIITLITWGISRKAKTVKKVRICTAVMVIFSVFLTSGIWLAIDNILPPVLKKATDSTINFEDVVENYDAKSDLHRGLLEKFIDMNVKNGNLKALTTEEYKEQGFKNEEVKKLVSTQFNCMHNDGYITFRGPWLNLANSNRLTVPAVVHLIINERVILDRHVFMVNGEEVDGTNWTILDMTPDAISITLPDLLATGLIKSIIDIYKDNILKYVNKAIADPALAGSPINININFTEGDNPKASLDITNTDTARGVFDYQNMAWFNSNGLLVMVISLFPDRHIMYVFGGIIAILSLAIGLIREKQYKKNFVTQVVKIKNGKPVTCGISASQTVANPQNNVAVENSSTMQYYNDDMQSPYLKAYYESLENYNKTLRK